MTLSQQTDSHTPSQVLELPEQSSKAENVMWDVVELNLLAVADANSISVYLYVPISLDGPSILLVSSGAVLK